jgi:hypothetical protein
MGGDRGVDQLHDHRAGDGGRERIRVCRRFAEDVGGDVGRDRIVQDLDDREGEQRP